MAVPTYSITPDGPAGFLNRSLLRGPAPRDRPKPGVGANPNTYSSTVFRQQ